MKTKHTKIDLGETGKKASSERRAIARTCVIPYIKRIELLNQILDELKKYDLDKDFLFWIRLSVDEAVINAITHGHGDGINDPKIPVRVDYVIDDNSIAVRVTDTGLGFNPSAVPDPTLEENLYRVTGRGIYLMRQAMDRVVYNSIGNSVLLLRKFQDPAVNE